MNNYGATGEPFLFIIDFELSRPEIYKLGSVPNNIKFSTPLFSNFNGDQIYTKPILLKKDPVPFKRYQSAFWKIQENIKAGNTYLANLTFPTRIEVDLTLNQIFAVSKAKYRLLYRDEFVVFSPEIFIRIEKGKITSYPMKGTIDASVEDASGRILNDDKEMAEHNTIVDLLRNDLSIVAENVSVTRSRYIDRIVTNERTLLQVSSEITGTLDSNYLSRLGDIVTRMLPAGSVTGAPKKETIRILKECEAYKRGWYTGVFGVFDGTMLDSCVMIRYIENTTDGLVFKSGGGITYLSDAEKEYQELISKVYIPVG